MVVSLPPFCISLLCSESSWIPRPTSPINKHLVISWNYPPGNRNFRIPQILTNSEIMVNQTHQDCSPLHTFGLSWLYNLGFHASTSEDKAGNPGPLCLSRITILFKFPFLIFTTIFPFCYWGKWPHFISTHWSDLWLRTLVTITVDFLP